MAHDEPPPRSRSRPSLQGAGKAYGIGIEFAAAVAGCCFVGWLFDRWLDSRPWGLLIGAIVGLIGGMYNLIRYAIRLNRDGQTKKNERDERDTDVV